jgi:iron complex transport system ATP-binding protein
MTVLLATRNLGVSIAGLEICRNLSINIENGSCWAILGRNGCGKTTLLKTLAGLHVQDAGEILFQGAPLNHVPRMQLARARGVLLQEQSLTFPGTILDAALVGRHPYLKPWQWETEEDVERARLALTQVGLTGKEGQALSTLSGGEQQRLAIATLLTQDPLLYLLDEPSTHLDMYHQIHILRHLRELADRQDKAMIMVLHDLNLAFRFCDHALLLFGADTHLHGPITEVLTEENLQRLYGYPIARFSTGQGEIFSPLWD